MFILTFNVFQIMRPAFGSSLVSGCLHLYPVFKLNWAPHSSPNPRSALSTSVLFAQESFFLGCACLHSSLFVAILPSCEAHLQSHFLYSSQGLPIECGFFLMNFHGTICVSWCFNGPWYISYVSIDSSSVLHWMLSLEDKNCFLNDLYITEQCDS